MPTDSTPSQAEMEKRLKNIKTCLASYHAVDYHDDAVALGRYIRTLENKLTIAVEALEDVATEQREETVGHVKKILPTRSAIKAMKTISRIRSL